MHEINADYRPIGALCSFDYGASELGATAAETGATSAATMAAENAALAEAGATAESVLGAGQAATAAQLGAGAGAFNMPSMADLSQGMQVVNALRSLGGAAAPQSTYSSLAPATATPTTGTLPGSTGATAANPTDSKGQESWWKDLMSGTGQGDQLPASIQDNIQKQASLIT